MDVIKHYDLLIEENNDPFRDPPVLQEYMCGWDGELFLEAMELSGNKKILEIGIGTGRIADKVAPCCMNLTGIDISPKTIERAKENLKEHTNISYVCDDFIRYRFLETYDVIYSSLTMMHFENKQQVIAKVDELLNSNGLLVLSIDKNQSEYIDIGTRKVRIYPDTPDNITVLIELTGMMVTNVFETDNAYIIVSKKKSDTVNEKSIFCSKDTEAKTRQQAINSMVRAISSILADCAPSIYLYGSFVLDDFRLGWSDIDILVLTEKQMSQAQAEKLVVLRQTMLEAEPDNLYYRSFEGGMLTLEAFLSKASDRVVYWGTSGERITDRYVPDSFSMAELVENSVLLCGQDIRENWRMPEYKELYADVKRHYETIRNYAQKTGRNFYSFGWMLDIARCIYTLRTGKIIAKTGAAEWALENNLCPDREALATALKVRKNPLEYKADKETFDYAETLGESIQRFADVLKKELLKQGKTLGE